MACGGQLRFAALSRAFTAGLASATGMAMQMHEYAVHADYAHLKEYADADENLIRIREGWL